MSILISVIVPVYNVENFLNRCIESILNQTYKKLEIILINDGSTDSSGSICEKYALQDRRIKVYHINNSGSSIARNYGLEVCSGDYIAFVDSDDWIMPGMFFELLKFSLKNNLMVVETESTSSLAIYEYSIEEFPIKGRIENKITALKRIISGTKFAVWRRLYHRSILENRYFIEHVLHQDVYYTIDILNEISQIGFVEYPFYIYNLQNPSSVIRSDYSIKKLQSINAGEYVLKNTNYYGSEIEDSAKRYLFNFLRYHYNSLFYHPHLDKNFLIRKDIRRTMKKYYSFNTFNFYSYVILLLPKSMYKSFLTINKKRIDSKNKIHQFLKNV